MNKMEKYTNNNESKWQKNILCFCFLLCKTAWAQNLIWDQFVDTSLKHRKQNYTSKQKNHKSQIVLINQPVLKLQSIISNNLAW